MLVDFLAAKPLFYDVIDYERMPRVYERIAAHFHLPKVIHIIGTNGKGTTGRFLATALHNIGFSVGHYTSPHILYFNERIWLDGNNVTDKLLEQTHRELLTILTQEEADSLSYFEYTTFLAMLLYSEKGVDFIILEAGLGGEHDATSVFENDLTLVTPIDMDHEAFLGDDIATIARTKLRAIQKTAIIAQQKQYKVYEVLREIEQERDIHTFKVESLLDKKDLQNIAVIAKQEQLALYLKENLMLSIAALKYFSIEYSAEEFKNAKLFGRLSVLEKNILVDVGHNVLAAKSIYEHLKTKKYTLVYNSYKDKNYRAILTVLKPLISEVELIDVYNARVEQSGFLQKSLDELGIRYKKFEQIDNEKEYLVFGSFSVVEAFLKVYNG